MRENTLHGEVRISTASDERLAAAHRAEFLTIGQLIKWEPTDASGAYSGLMIVGEKATPQGFQSVSNMTIDIGAKEISPAKVQELSSGEYRIYSKSGYVP